MGPRESEFVEEAELWHDEIAVAWSYSDFFFGGRWGMIRKLKIFFKGCLSEGVDVPFLQPERLCIFQTSLIRKT